MTKKPWLLFALITTISWGVWGAFIEIPEKAGFPATLGYIVWALTMIPCAIVALAIIKWKLDTDLRSIIFGLVAGLLGAGGQLLLFEALRDGPAYIVFPFIGLYPVLTIALSIIILKEKAGRKQWLGIAIALIAGLFIAYKEPGDTAATGSLWLILSIGVFVMWAVQSFIMKYSNITMKAESIFFYMTLGGLLLIPFAYFMTDFSQEINWSFKGPYLAAIIHVLNSIGALTLVYALRYGKAIVIIPMVGVSPRLITIVVSLAIYSVLPGPVLTIGLLLAIIAIGLMLERKTDD